MGFHECAKRSGSRRCLRERRKSPSSLGRSEPVFAIAVSDMSSTLHIAGRLRVGVTVPGRSHVLPADGVSRIMVSMNSSHTPLSLSRSTSRIVIKACSR